MARGLTLSAGLTAFIALVLVHETYCTATANVTDQCTPSFCGNINISYPFRLMTDPKNCSDSRYELRCEKNHTAVLSIFGGKYYVKEIDYSAYTFRIVDSGIQNENYFSSPKYSLYRLGQYYFAQNDLSRWLPDNSRLNWIMIFMSCEKPVNTPLYLNTSTCIYNGEYSSNSSISHSKRYKYVTIGEVISMTVKDVKDSCKVEQTVMTSWPPQNDNPNISCTEVHNQLAYGFRLSWYPLICERICGRQRSCTIDELNRVQCDSKSTGLGLLVEGIDRLLMGEASISKRFNCKANAHVILFFVKNAGLGLLVEGINRLLMGEDGYILFSKVRFFLNIVVYKMLIFTHAAKMSLGAPCVVAFLIYKWRRRHLSMYDAVEEFLQSQNNLMPIRYSYSQIKKMTKGFEDKLGEGGYGSVFKGKLQSGHLVAIKMLGESKANGQDFISEVATIGRIHHSNVVQLIGFCAEGPRRALIYEFMPNSSLDKYIFIQEGRILLSIEKTYEISLGVARGIEYLHRGCDMQILHFDIKPHNILLDEKFTPKVSDFGLAKLYPTDKSIVSLTAARGTLGYIAPELFYKNIGGVSYKADVYSFGMLLLEMASKRKNFNEFADHSSQSYLPTWAYDQVSKGNEILMEDVVEEEKKIVKKMIMVALWCIQMKPSDRPSMNKVVEMLEGEVECLQMPSKPFLSSLGDVGDNLNPTCSSIQSGESSQSAQV
ncbi:LEAF RUST 10 DISEASE-RESISTANCE LOCUS RECEPTOR-LIKE PROTEIN KINASE-like 2.5 [Castanea sativa]|uniref:LEAF RUST 10 DISEASE-RESISTANCE LOCUS RECEPTOR-LIKE PROTEIN KINASE-like 2.5 n=1 Tax=Castanea sativa TaxID=21020 RepID=UPI003F64DCAD